LQFKRKHKIEKFTVVADAAMISDKNITALASACIQYIVGARIANLSIKHITEISAQLSQRDGATVRVETELGDLICEFSAKRFAKNKRELEKYITKAEMLLKNPGNMKRAKFITSEHKTYSLNTALIEKTKLLLGIKGYYTNLPKSEFSDNLVIEHYHNLRHVELAFRIAKVIYDEVIPSEQMRPIYHFKQETIKAHILICSMALAVCPIGIPLG